MTVNIQKSIANGKISAPTSKSVAHRLLICAAMCRGESHISGISSCEDVLATIDCLRALGVKIDYDGECAIVSGIDFTKAQASDILKCRESGSTLRFLIPLALLCGKDVCFNGTEKLISRPLDVYEDIAKTEGLLFEKKADTIAIRGPLKAGEYKIPGNISSQFITGMLFALSALKEDSRIVITTSIESRSYIDLTVAAMAEFGVEVKWENTTTLFIRGGQDYVSSNVSVEGDFSGTAFIEAFNLLGGKVFIDGLNESSLQGDKIYREHFKAINNGFCKIDIDNYPDLGPILFTLAAIKHGGYFTGTKRLKIKESDRAEAMREELRKFGAELIIDDNSVTVEKCSLHTPTEQLCGHNDHRIVMSLAVICSYLGGKIEGCEAVKKSYPDFFKDIKTLGIDVYEIN